MECHGATGDSIGVLQVLEVNEGPSAKLQDFMLAFARALAGQIK